MTRPASPEQAAPPALWPGRDAAGAWPPPPANGRLIPRSRRTQWFMVWMVGLGGFYLLLVVGLLGADLFYLQWTQLRTFLWSETIREAIKLSLVTSVATVALSLLVGVPAGYLLSRHRFPGSVVIDTLLDMPIVLPPLVVGISLLIFFNTAVGQSINDGLRVAGRWLNTHVLDLGFDGLVFTREGVILAQFTVAAAFGIRTLKATFDQIDPRIEAVARTLGASRGQAFFRVTLPMARDGILAAAVMTWARAIGEFGPIMIFCGTTPLRTEVMPTAIYLEFSVGRLQTALAVSMLMVLIAMVTLLLFKKIGGRRYL